MTEEKFSKALVKLKQIILTSDDDNRLNEYKRWLEEWVDFVEFSQLCLNSSVLSFMEKDFAYDYVTKMCSEELIEKNIAELSLHNNRFNCYIVGLRHKPGVVKNEELKENQSNSKKIK